MSVSMPFLLAVVVAAVTYPAQPGVYAFLLFPIISLVMYATLTYNQSLNEMLAHSTRPHDEHTTTQ